MADKLMYIPNDNRIKYFVGVKFVFWCNWKWSGLEGGEKREGGLREFFT